MFNKIRMKRSALLGLISGALFALSLFGSVAWADVIVARGSDSTIDAVKALAEAFEKETGTAINVEGGGSSKGAKDCLAGKVDLAFMSRAPKQKEIDAGLVAVPYAIDGVAVIVHKNNPLEDITTEQLKAIYTGEMKKWPDGKAILALNRPGTSGTREVFQKKVLGKEGKFDPAVKIKHHLAALMTVSKAVTAVAYTSAGALSGDEAIKVLTVNGVAPTADNLRQKTYPLSRTPHFGTKGEPTGKIKEFLDFVVSEKGKKVVAGVGFVPLGPVTVSSTN